LVSDEDTKILGVDRPKITPKKSRPKKNRPLNEDISRDESEDGSCDHDPYDLSDSHPKKHHFHFPIFHSLRWNHKRTISHKKERDGEHSNEHETDIERVTNGSTRRYRDSEPHRRHTISPRFVPSFFEETPPTEVVHNEIMTKN